MYPLNVSLPAGAGFAIANDEAEHESLTASGYLPALVKAPEPLKALLPVEPDGEDVATDEIAAVKAKLTAAGIRFHPNTGLEKLKALLPA